MEGITRDYVGFCKGMKPMTVGKIANQLEKKSRWECDGKKVVTSNMAFVAYKVLQEGCVPEIHVEEYGYHYEYTHWGREKVWGKLDKPKTTYRLSDKEDGTFYEVNKTLYDFGVYVMENFNDFADIQNAEKEEMERIENKKARIEKEKLDAEKAEEQARIDKENFERYCIEESIKLANTKVFKVAEDIFKAVYGDADFNRFNLGSFFDRQTGKTYEGVNRNMVLFICAREIDNPLAKDMLIHWLYNDNKASVKLFGVYSGLKMPRNYKDRVELINSLTSEDICLMEI